MVGIKGLDMPAECGKCLFFNYRDKLCGNPPYFLNTKCLLEYRDDKDGWIGHQIEYGKYYRSGEHAIKDGERWSGCRLMEVKEK